MKPETLETNRLIIRQFVLEDASFILELVNEPGWIRYIGNKNVRDIASACTYLQKGPIAMYQKLGIGLMRVDSKEHGIPIGMCGLLKRDSLPDVDIGFAFLERWQQFGYAMESARAVIQHGWNVLELNRILAVTTQDNERSIKLLIGIGFTFEKFLKLNNGTPEAKIFVANHPKYFMP